MTRLMFESKKLENLQSITTFNGKRAVIIPTKEFRLKITSSLTVHTSSSVTYTYTKLFSKCMLMINK